MAGADMYNLVQEFYGTLNAELLATPDEFKKAHDKWLSDFRSYKDTYVTQLAKAAFDYTATVCFGEMRHARARASKWNPHVPQGGSRSDSYMQAKAFTARSILRAAVSCFGVQWKESYGGPKWKMIAEAGLKYDVMDPVSWIDYIVDLKHNGAPYFDKSSSGILYLGQTISFSKYLNFKLHALPSEILSKSLISKHLGDHILRGRELGILPPDTPYTPDPMTTAFVDWILNYKPVNWGSAELPDQLVGKNAKGGSIDAGQVPQPPAQPQLLPPTLPHKIEYGGIKIGGYKGIQKQRA